MTCPPTTIQHFDNEYLEDGFWYLSGTERRGSTSEPEECCPTEVSGYQPTTYPDFTQPSSTVGQTSLPAPQPLHEDRNESAATSLSGLSTQGTRDAPPPEHTIDSEQSSQLQEDSPFSVMGDDSVPKNTDEEKDLKFKERFDESGLKLYLQLISYGIPHGKFLRGLREASNKRTIYDAWGHRVSCLPCISCPIRRAREYIKYGATCDRIVLRKAIYPMERCATCAKRFDNYKRWCARVEKTSDRKPKPLLPKSVGGEEVHSRLNRKPRPLCQGRAGHQ